MSPHEARLGSLQSHGWRCITGHPPVNAMSSDGCVRECIWCDGPLFGAPRSIYLDVHDGTCLLIGEMRDVPFADLQRWLESGCEYETLVAAVRKSPQRSLFED